MKLGYHLSNSESNFEQTYTQDFIWMSFLPLPCFIVHTSVFFSLLHMAGVRVQKHKSEIGVLYRILMHCWFPGSSPISCKHRLHIELHAIREPQSSGRFSAAISSQYWSPFCSSFHLWLLKIVLLCFAPDLVSWSKIFFFLHILYWEGFSCHLGHHGVRTENPVLLLLKVTAVKIRF